MEIEGLVTKVGKPKPVDDLYTQSEGQAKFYVELETKEGLVHGNIHYYAFISGYGKITIDTAHCNLKEKPWNGDKVKVILDRKKPLKKFVDKPWFSCYTMDSDNIEIIIKNQKARDEWNIQLEQKKQEREQEFQKNQEESKQKSKELKQKRLDEINFQKADQRIPEDVRKEITGSFDVDRIIRVLRDTTWFAPIHEGEGGKRDMGDGEAYVGTGMRKPSGCLYNTPEKWRKSILEKAQKIGLIESSDSGYKSTKKGIELLIVLDTCPKCKKLRKAYHVVTAVRKEWSADRYESIGYFCECEILQKTKHQGLMSSSNVQIGYQKFKIPKSLEKVID